MRKKIFKSLILAPVLVVGMLLITGYLLVATESGSRWLVQQSSKYLLESVQLEGVQGRLINDFVIQRLQFSSCGKENELNEIRINWNPKHLINSVIKLNNITLGSAIINKCEDGGGEFIIPDNIELPVQILVDNLHLNSLTIKNKNQQQYINQIQGSIYLQNGQFEIKKLLIETSPYTFSTSLKAELKKPFALTGDMQWSSFDKSKTKWQGSITIDGNIDEIQGKHTLLQPFQANSKFSFYSPLQGLSFVAKNQWESISLPIGQEPKIIIENGELDIEGDLNAVSYKLKTYTKSQYLLSTALVKVNGDANKELVTIDKIHIKTDEGILSGKGKIELKPELQTSLSIQANKINPENFIANLPGELNFTIDIHAKRTDQDFIAGLELKTLTGTLRDYEVIGNGNLRYSLYNIYAENLYLAIGDNHINVNGKLDTEDSKADFKVTANNLAQLHPNLAGGIQGKGSFMGSINAPHVRATLTGNGIKFNNQLSIDDIKIDGDVHVFSDQISNVKIKAINVTINQNTLDTIGLIANGNQQQHQVDLDIHGKDIVSSLNITGSYIDDIWNASVNQLDAELPDYGDWKITDKSTIIYASKGYSLSKTCLHNENSLICIQGHTDKKSNWLVEGEISDFPLQLLAKGYEDQLKIDGVGGLNFNLHGGKGKFEGELNALSKDVILTSPTLDEQNESILVERFEIIGDIHPVKSKFDLMLIMDKGQVSGSATVEKIHDREHAYIKEARFNSEIPSIKFLNTIFPRIIIKEGMLTANANLHGYLRKPKVEGNIKLKRLMFYVPDLGTEYRQGVFSAKTTEWNHIDIEGNLHSQSGDIELGGRFNIQEKSSYFLVLKGNNFQVLNFPDKNLALTPNLTIQGNASAVDINGDIYIPTANLILKELPKGTIKKTKDEVFVSKLEDGIKEESKNKIAVTGKIQLVLGDDIHFEGKGMQTDLSGDLLVLLDDERIPNGQGVLHFNNASYQVLGQTMQIDTGKMLFAGPINNPELDVIVKRDVKDITTGIKIVGTLQKPKTTVFSSPVMSDGNALSYLISGRPLSEASGSQNALLAKAALSLGVKNSASITQQIGSSLGLDEFSIAGGESFDSTSLILGKYLSPKLYVSYVQGLFTPVGTVGFDYQLTKSLSIEAESGLDQSIDFIYKIERE